MIALKNERSPMLKTVEFNGQPCQPAIEIQEIGTDRVLSAEFESGEPAGFQGEPELLFLFGLFPSETTRVLDGVHELRLNKGRKKTSPSPCPLPARPSRGEGI